MLLSCGIHLVPECVAEDRPHGSCWEGLERARTVDEVWKSKVILTLVSSCAIKLYAEEAKKDTMIFIGRRWIINCISIQEALSTPSTCKGYFRMWLPWNWCPRTRSAMGRHLDMRIYRSTEAICLEILKVWDQNNLYRWTRGNWRPQNLMHDFLMPY